MKAAYLSLVVAAALASGVAGVKGRTAPAGWEYRMLSMRDVQQAKVKRPEDYERWLDSLGRDRWELVQYWTNPHDAITQSVDQLWLFKRQLGQQ